jgi:hypothetical protein
VIIMSSSVIVSLLGFALRDLEPQRIGGLSLQRMLGQRWAVDHANATSYHDRRKIGLPVRLGRYRCRPLRYRRRGYDRGLLTWQRHRAAEQAGPHRHGHAVAAAPRLAYDNGAAGQWIASA